MLVTVDELGKTSLYPEIIETITRGSTDAAQMQIMAAESLVRSYMSKYDTLAIFGDMQNAPTYMGADVELIKKVVKIIASYYLVRLANPNVNIELYRADYEDALAWLKQLQAGEVNPNLPYAPDDPNTPENETENSLYWGSNPKRDNHF
jgi:hypothetical protein